jgi:integrase
MMLERKNHVNTIHSNLKVLRKIITDAIAEELIPIEKNPFNKIKLKGQKTSRLFLLDHELEKLELLQLEENSQLNHHRNLYIFSAYSAGIRISDLLLMRWKNFNGQHLCFQMKKTKEDLSVKLPEKSLDILSFYQNLANNKCGEIKIDPESFIFPLLRIPPTEINKIKLFNAISSAVAYTNKDLRKLRLMAGIDKKFSFHSARHSWAVRALQKGMRIEYVSKLMGHASVKQTEVYAQILNEELDKAMEIFNEKKKA